MVTDIVNFSSRLIDVLKRERTEQLELLDGFKSGHCLPDLTDDCVKSLANVSQRIEKLQHFQSLINLSRIDEAIRYFMTLENRLTPTAIQDCFFEEGNNDLEGLNLYASLLHSIMVYKNIS